MNRFMMVVTVMAFIIIAGVFAYTIVTLPEDASKAPVDWNPNVSCATHGKISSVHGADVAEGVTCRDGTYFKNPYG